MYLILMYLIPVTQFLNDVPTSDVSKSVTSSGAEGGDPKTPPQQINFLEEAAAMAKRRAAAALRRP